MVLTTAELEKYADVLLWGLKTARKSKFKKGDIILIQYENPALPLAEILFKKIVAMGMHPVQRMGLTFGMEKGFFEEADDKQLVFIPPGEKELYENVNGRIFLRAPESLTHLKDIDPARIGTVLVSRKPLKDILDKREEQGFYSWTLCTFPTHELAWQAKTTIRHYAAQIIKACYLDKENPVQEWESILNNVHGIKKWLNSLKIKTLHIEAKNIDLTITPGEKRKWSGVSGHNIPSFEIFFSPDWRGTEGTYYANLPSFRSGNYVKGIRLTFQKGAVVKIEADEGEQFAIKQLAMDKGASRIGEFSLTDRRFSRIDRFMADTLFDENFGGRHGNSHIAVGSSYTESYTGNQADMTKQLKEKLGFNDSALHWDLVNTERKTVTAHLTSGKRLVIYEDGQFKV
ncbi:MAG TPA: aminopeptidase [Syntrophorhabdus sp.]|jgi:aminopeptidase|nr:MAG: Aminopeptidase T [Syntrophorhabdus sp. PtaB.Bin027]OQB76479.1 MAG: Aminopeptidase T [Deltaproteobacteria bacterium ADurb.Bin135]HNQ47467.1 aminopeptidase [Syntrophorhabdus sp.]HNS77522.1 aminopeptidase [Syntrophorhabdus sp.]HPW35369.1 aminopeptidase [Syntrophorhabdus sp.]